MKKIFVIIIIFILSLSFVFSVYGSTSTEHMKYEFSAIRINGDSEFTPENGVSSGNGTYCDPYIINNLNINASLTHGVYISNTTRYFIIKNCTVYGGEKNFQNGIYFSNVINGMIISCKITNNLNGIYLHRCANITLKDNEFIKNVYGVHVWSSLKTTLASNKFAGDGLYIDGDELAHYIMNVEDNNDVNGKKIIYLYNKKEVVIEGSGKGQIFIVNCTDISLINFNVFNVTTGFQIVYSTNVSVMSGSISWCQRAIRITHSNRISISNFIIKNNTYCINLEFSNNNFIFNNTLFSHGLDGMSLVFSNLNHIFGNTIIFSNFYGVFIAYSHNNSVYNNRVSRNHDGIYLYASNSNIIANNDIIQNDYIGIIFRTSHRNRISNNSISFNEEEGIWLENSGYNYIICNNITQNTYFGIYATNSIRNKIVCNNFIKNSFGARKQAYDDKNMNYWNDSKKGNYWSDHTEPDKNYDYIVDTPYKLAGKGNAKDYYPLAEPTWKSSKYKPPLMIGVVIVIVDVIGILLLIIIIKGLRKSEERLVRHRK